MICINYAPKESEELCYAQGKKIHYAYLWGTHHLMSGYIAE